MMVSQGRGTGASVPVDIAARRAAEGQPGRAERTQDDLPAGLGHGLESGPPRPLRILVVDDNEDAALTLAMMLRALGHDARTAGSGEEALRLAGEYRPDAALLDLGLPDMSGHEVARRLRGEPWGGTMILAATTGWGRDEDRRRSHEAGFDHHLVKPFDPADLRAVLATVRPSPGPAAPAPSRETGDARPGSPPAGAN